MNGSNKDFDALLVSMSKELIEQAAKEVDATDTICVEYPSKLDNKIMRKIKAEQDKEKRVRYIRVFKNIAAAFMILCTATLFFCLSVDGVRAEIWNMVVDLTGGRTKVIIDTNVDVPDTILTFKEPTIEPEGLIKKVLYKADDYLLIAYMKNEDDLFYDSYIAFAQMPVTAHDGIISESGSQKDFKDILINNIIGKLAYGNKGITIYWHDDEYVYTITCKDNEKKDLDSSTESQWNSELELLIRMAESVK